MIKPFDFIAVKLTLLLVLGLLFGYILEITPLVSGSLAAAGLCLLGLATFNKQRLVFLFGCSAAFVVLSIGMLLFAMAFQPNQAGHYSQKDYEGDHLWRLKIFEIGNTTDFGQSYVARVISLDRSPARGKIRLRIRHPSISSKKTLHIDDDILVWGNVSKPAAALNPYQWEYDKYLRNQNIYHQLLISPGQAFTLSESRVTLKGWAHGLRSGVICRLEQAGFGEEELGIIKALLLGQRRDIAPEIFNQYQRAGAVHILAISGLHIGILLILLRAIFHPLTLFPGGKGISLWLTVIILWAYALIAGFSPSVIRAVSMFSFLAYSLFLNRLAQSYNTLALSMFFLLVFVDPYLIFQAGFQMSYAAVLAILWVHPIFMRLWTPRNRILKRAWQLLAVSLSAQMGVLPISLYYFHQFPGLFMVSSLVIVPLLGLVLSGGVVIIALSLLESLPGFIADLYNQLIANMNGFIAWLARQDYFFFEHLSFDATELMLGYAILTCLVILLKKPSAIALRTMLIAIILFQGYAILMGHVTRETERVFILHQFANPVLVYQQGLKLEVHGSTAESGYSVIQDFQVGARIKKLKYLQLKKNYTINGRHLIRLDSAGVEFPTERKGILWLTHSPRFNLDRYITYADPVLIVADGSNYNYLVRRWQQSAALRNIPFHFTGDSGAFLFEL